jgi:hypothetical protein
MRIRRVHAIGAMLVAACGAVGCTHAMLSSWKAPDAEPFPLQGEKVAAIVMTTDVTTRRAGEAALARQLSRRGVAGVPMYELLGGDPANEATARAAAERAGVVGVVVMRPVRVEKALFSTGGPYVGPMSGGFWGEYFGHGWASAWPAGEVRSATIVTIETRVYSLPANRLLWAGQSTTADPRNLERLVADTARQVSDELARLGLMPARTRA